MIDNTFADTLLWVILFIFIFGVSYMLINMCYSYFNREEPLLIPYYSEDAENSNLPE